MKLSKVKVGEQYYFDILGKTDKNETYTVSVIRKFKFKRKCTVISNQTKECFDCNTKYLVPIYDSDISNYNCIIRNANSIINIDEIDYEILKTIKDLISTDDNIEKEYKNKIEAGLDMILIKMSLIIKNNNSCDILNNIYRKRFEEDTNKIKKIVESSSKSLIPDENDDDHTYYFSEDTEEKMNEFIGGLLQALTDNDEDFDVYDYFNNIPDGGLSLEIMTRGDKASSNVSKFSINEFVNKIFKFISSDCNNIVFVPYYKLDNTKSVLIFDSSYNMNQIYNTLDSVLKQTSYIITYALQCIVLNKNGDDEMDED